MRHGSQAAHDAADAERVGDGLAQAVFLRHFEVGHGARLVAADLKGDDDEVRTDQRLALVGIGLGPCFHAERRDQLVDDDSAFFQPLRIDVHQRDCCSRQGRSLQHVADNVLHEHRRASAYECDPGISCHATLRHKFRLDAASTMPRASRPRPAWANRTTACGRWTSRFRLLNSSSSSIAWSRR